MPPSLQVLILVSTCLTISAEVPDTFIDYDGIVDALECEIKPLEKWLENLSTLSQDDNSTVTTLTNDTEALMTKNVIVDIRTSHKLKLLKPDEDVSIIIESHTSDELDVYMELKTEDSKNPSCGVGGFLLDMEHTSIGLNNELTKDTVENLKLGSCFNWVSLRLSGKREVSIPYTAPECGCNVLSVYTLVSNATGHRLYPNVDHTIPHKTIPLCVDPNPTPTWNVLFENPNLEESQEVEEMTPPKVEALSSLPKTKEDKLTTKRERKLLKKENRQKKRKEARKSAKILKKQNKENKAAAKPSPDDAPMCVGCKGWRKWVKRQKKRKQAKRRERKGKNKRRNRKYNSIEKNMTTEAVQDVSSFARSAINTTEMKQSGESGDKEQDEESSVEFAMYDFLGIQRENDATTIEPEDESGVTSQIAEKDVTADNQTTEGVHGKGNPNKGINKKKRKWAKKQLKKAKKNKQMKKRVSVGERMCCKQGIQNKKLHLYLKDVDTNESEICLSPSKELLIWAPHKFKTSPDLCKLRFNQCCTQFTLEWLDNWKQKKAARKAKRKLRKRKEKELKKSKPKQDKRARRKDQTRN